MPQSRHPDWEPITAYVAAMSYFSGKMEAYLRYKEIPFERRVVGMKVMRDEILPATGLMKVPVLRLADGQWLKDTTPMIEWLESHYPEPPVILKDPVLRFMSKLVEDYADEWCWRASLYWRWQPRESRRLLMRQIGHEVLNDFPAPNWLAGWYFGRRQIATYLKGDGLSTETEPHIRQQYLDLLDAMSTLLEDQPYLLGSHPTLVDIGLFGPMFRHYAQDPVPSRVMEERAPAVFAWVGRVCSARAWAAGQPRFDHQAHGVTYENLKVVHYRVYCLEVLQNEYRNLNEPDRRTVDDLLRPYGAIELIEGLDSGLMEEFELPLRPDRVQPSRLQRFKLALMGTPWDMPVKPDERERP